MKTFEKILVLLFLFAGVVSCGVNFSKTDGIKEWSIDEYKILYSRYIGPVGPHYYQYDVYKNGRYLSYTYSILDNDSCLLQFEKEADYYIHFNLCKQTKKILEPNKTELVMKNIDSITIRPYDSIDLVVGANKFTRPYYDTLVRQNFDPSATEKLNPQEIKMFVRKWNKSEAEAYNRLGKSYDYLLTVYTKDTVRRIKTLNHFLTEDGKWSYRTKEDNFFDELWKKEE
ncbi:MAG: hypothetical protein R3277_05405 [Brumimicrobium sp.]|nr:hypothetical protein [Brumimicrobium sp.]